MSVTPRALHLSGVKLSTAQAKGSAIHSMRTPGSSPRCSAGRGSGVPCRSRSVARRLGWLLEQYREGFDLEPLRKVADPDLGYPTRLVRALPAQGPIDPSWNLQVNSDVEPDL